MIGAEDCLYLNVYTPELPSDTNNSPKKSVMVWVHGGALTIGSGNSDTYGPEYLLINDVIVVTINYRLGLLGEQQISPVQQKYFMLTFRLFES